MTHDIILDGLSEFISTITMTPDIINGSFEFAGAGILLLNVRRLHLDKVLRGVHWSPAAFFTAWGLWNLYFYPYLDQWFSFFGGLALVGVNAIWIGQVIYYKLRS